MTTSFNLADLFGVVAAVVPEREAVVQGARRLTYGQLEERSERLADVLTAAGVGPGDPLGLQLYNSSEYLEGMLAAFKVRALPVNVNHRYKADELHRLFADAGLVALIHDASFGSIVDEVTSRLPSLRLRLARGAEYEEALADASLSRAALLRGRSGNDDYILYTGGTTGPPKGVVWRHEDIFFAALGGGGRPVIERPDELAERAVRGRTRLLPACPLMHGSGHWMALSTLFGGGTVVLDDRPSFDPAAIWDVVAAESVRSLVIVGDAFARPLADALGEGGGGSQWDLSSLTVILSGGAMLSPDSRDALLRRLPGCMVVDGFGSSETGGHGQAVAVAGIAHAHPRFAMDDRTAVLGEDLRPLRPGSGKIGRLARRGRIPRGYRDDARATAATFPVVDGVRWAVPGDLARVEADGTITVLGRGSTSINTGGEKVHPEEVEAVLKGHAAVLDAVVVGLPDARWGERVVAVVQLRAGSSPEAASQLVSHTRSKLAGYKVPRSFVVVDEVVRSATGKPDYDWARRVAGAGISKA